MSDLANGDLVFDDGVDRTIWQARLEDLEPDLHTSPAEALPELGRLIREMQDMLGATAEPNGGVGDEDSGEVLAVADRLDAGEPVSDEEMSDAVDAGLRVAWYLLQDRRGPHESLEE